MLLSRIGPIALEEPLGGSADSNVLRGLHIDRNMTMAVKLLPRQLVNRPMGGDTYAEDVKRLQGLVHPHIARVYGGAMDNGQPYLAMELVKGESLRSMLDRRGRIPWETMVDLAEQICEALQFAHGKEVVHRRLTPSRVLVTDEGGVKLIGFDCALADRDLVAGLKSPMTILHYLSPQEIRAQRSVGLPSNDLFSLGVILYEALTGELPWPANTPAELVHARQAAPAPHVSARVLECPRWLDVLVARLLEVKREGRLTTADAARRAIVDAKSKVAAGMGAAQHALSGRQGALAKGVDRQELSRLRKAAAASAPKDTSPFYERAWFLGLCLAALVGVGVWAMWPLSDEQLFAKAQPLMESELRTDWERARDDYLAELSAEFRQGEHRAEIEEFELRLAIHQAEERIKNLDRFGRKPKFEVDRLYAEAWEYEQFGDLLSAWQHYESLLRLHPATDETPLEERAILELARQRIEAIRSEAREEALAEERRALVESKLERAGELAETDPLRARGMLEDIVTLYDGNQDLAPLVEQAREQIRALRSRPDEQAEPEPTE
jgi:hypothetical protein